MREQPGWDVTAPDTLAPSHINNTAQIAGSAAVKAEVSKTAKYSSLSRTHRFIPLAFETLGAWGPCGLEFLNDLGRRITGVTGEKREGIFLKQIISLAIQRGNAIACRGTLTSQDYRTGDN